ncbi:hypothetical protein [Priestia megaterium]|uniref:hypothetical protein n=1 Tax=Priestia megaterium TaxID=1404 RepID=UPI001596522C|nr:hypothetical protein [Priestia megaterium]
MKDNRTAQLCDNCNSHITIQRHNGKIIIECSYCGEVPEDIHSFDLELDDDD